MKKEMKDVLHPNGELDILYYYSQVSGKLKSFLKGKEIASKIWLPNGFFFIKRGSKIEPLHIEELSIVEEKLLKLRAENNLADVKSKISKQQAKIWDYFVPRKLIDFFYATNNEGVGRKIDRVFFDIDRGSNISEEHARIVAQGLVEAIKKDKEFSKIVKYRISIIWTGSSFHVYLLFSKLVEKKFYERYIRYSKDSPLESFTGRWALETRKKTGLNVQGGHEKVLNQLNIDPSQTPSGKLARVPFSLHMKDAKTVDGIAIPLNEKQLNDKNLVKKLKSYTPEKVLSELDSWGKNL